MINVLVYIALMGFISVLYVIVVLYIDEEKNRQELLATKQPSCCDCVLQEIVWNL